MGFAELKLAEQLLDARHLAEHLQEPLTAEEMEALEREMVRPGYTVETEHRVSPAW